ncbi:MAG: Gfo/Idh/MocA family oxidoreductase [Candidatus Omnitrophica bacterium]|nr:Gfo/Idh/MocA family oxidoreductase [Candidatus Omnitrophota bacterium]
MKRRHFLFNTSVMAAGSSLIGNSASWAQANERLRIAIIGTGWRGGQLLPVAAKTPNVEISTLCDPDERRMNEWNGKLKNLTGKEARLTPDLRDVVHDDSIDAVVISSPNHWHALTAIWASQQGKHTYVEKPVCYAIHEGRMMVEAVRKYNRISQGGPQRRSSDLFRKAIDRLRDGAIGDLYMAKALVLKERESLGFKPVKEPPSWLHWDLWKGPGPDVGYHENLVHYNWHWFWDFGNGEMANNGIHLIDVCRWGLNKKLPIRIHSSGGRFGYIDQGETPNVQQATFEYEDGTILKAETRGLPTNTEGDIQTSGAIFYGSKGYMVIDNRNARIYRGSNDEPEIVEGKGNDAMHFRNFVDGVRSQKREALNAEIEEIFLSSCLPLLANISYRLKREMRFDPVRMNFIEDRDADAMLTRIYREPYVLPESV